MATSEIRQKSRARITAQAGGTALTAGVNPNGSYTGGAATPIDNTYDGGSENALGAMFLNLELDVTAAPSIGEATAEIWYRGSEDNSTWSKWKYSHTIGEPIVITTATRYAAGLFELIYQYTELKVVAVGYAFTATLLATAKLYEAQ